MLQGLEKDPSSEDAAGFKNTLRNSLITEEVVLRNLNRRRNVLSRVLVVFLARLEVDFRAFRGPKSLTEE